MINLSSINKKYITGQTEISVLKNIDLQIEKGEFVGIIGPSGSGKSTLLNLMGFIDRAFEGSYQFNHKRIEKYTDNELSQIRNVSVGFVFQNFGLIENKSVLENVELPLIYGGESRRKAREKVEDILDKLGLRDKIEMKPRELSGG